MEASALTSGTALGHHGRSPLLRLQSDERLIALVRRGNHGAFETLVARYQSRLLAFCRHMLGSREDAEDVLQEVFAAAFNAMLADERPINARPWLYRIARNRCLNHLRRAQAIGVDSMDIHLSEHGTTTADKVDKREQFRELIADVQELPETQRTALLLREIDALSYDQIAEAMETTIPSVKSLLVRARVSLAEAAEARLLSCDDVRIELGEIAEGLRRRTTPPVRRHLRGCERCTVFRTELRATSKALALLLPVGPLLILKKLLIAHLGLSSMAGAGGAGGASGAGAGGAAIGVGAVAGTTSAVSSSGLISAGLGALGAKAAAGIAAAALLTAGAAVEVEQTTTHRHRPQAYAAVAPHRAQPAAVQPAPAHVQTAPARVQRALDAPARAGHDPRSAATPSKPRDTTTAQTTPATTPTTVAATPPPVADPGRTQVETGSTTLPSTAPAEAPPPTLVPLPPPAGTTTTATTPTTTTPPPTTTTPPPSTSTTPAPPPETTPPAEGTDPGTTTATAPAPSDGDS
ncbi:MAG TPA: RNA polymerase sigma factor [Conexibacter sp.]|nr:RNA polymerase sigma factor [Conexibacter sp.]